MQKCLTIDEVKLLAEKLITINIDDNNFHIENLKKNGINWNNRKIINLINKIKQKLYPNDDKFINNILNTTIKYNNIEYNFVPVKYKYHDQKTNKNEKIIILTSKFIERIKYTFFGWDIQIMSKEFLPTI